MPVFNRNAKGPAYLEISIPFASRNAFQMEGKYRRRYYRRHRCDHNDITTLTSTPTKNATQDL